MELPDQDMEWEKIVEEKGKEEVEEKEEFHLPCFMLWKDIMHQLNIFLIQEGHKVVEKSFFQQYNII